MDRPIPDDDAAILRTIFKLPEDVSLDDETAVAYWQLSRSLRCAGHPVTPRDLAYLAVLLHRPTPPAPLSILPLIAEGRIAVGDTVCVYFRDEWVSGIYESMKGKKVIVTLHTSPEVRREVVATTVRPATRDELVSIGA